MTARKLRITGSSAVDLAEVSGMRVIAGVAMVMVLEDGLPVHLATLTEGESVPEVAAVVHAYLVGAPEAQLDPSDIGTAPTLDPLPALAAASEQQVTRKRLITTYQQASDASRAVAAAAMSSAVESGDAATWAPPDPSMRACARVCEWAGVRPSSPFPAQLSDLTIPKLRRMLAERGIRTRLVAVDSAWVAGGAVPAIGLTAPGEGPTTAVALTPTRNGMKAVDAEGRDGAAVTVEATVLEVISGVKLRRRGRWVRPHVRMSRWQIASLLFWCLLGAGTSLLVPYANSIVFSAIVPDNDMVRLLWLGAALTAALLLGAFAATRVGLLAARIRAKGEYTAQLALWQKFLAMPVTAVLAVARGDMALRLMSPIMTRSVLPTPLAASTVTGSFALASLFLLFRGGTLLGIAGVLLVLVELAILYRSARHQRLLVQESLRQTRLQSALAVDMLTSISIVRSSGAEDRVGAHWARTFASQTQARHRLALSNATTATILTVFPTLASTLIVVFVAVQGAYDVSAAEYLMFTAALAQAIGAVAILASGLLPSLTVSETLRQASSVVEAPVEASSAGGLAPTLRGSITVAGVSYRYGPDSPPVLHDVSIKIRPGEFVAFVGPSGAGKSSLLRLLLGFDSPEAGSILYDGVDLRSIDPEHLRSQLGVVLQSSRLIRGTIGENIRVGRALTDNQVWEAAEAAGVAATLRSLPMGLSTPIVNEGSLSGGQRQRLVIARALAGNPAILILDEATSALDNATQAHVTACINELATTRIVIAHRLSTVRDADRIIVMERGRIVETGSPDELLRTGGLFAALAARQLA
jgi:ABC-type bacteriocin/lantibiotic exporter with double-glycine peptidase domain